MIFGCSKMKICVSCFEKEKVNEFSLELGHRLPSGPPAQAGPICSPHARLPACARATPDYAQTAPAAWYAGDAG
jgi:hypothetical protein